MKFYFNHILDVKNFYDKHARFYDISHHFQTLFADNLHRLEVAKAANFSNNDLVLDIGTGTSLAAICAVHHAYPLKRIRIVGVDLSANMLQKARKNLERYNIKEHIINVNCDGRHLPFRKSLFDKIISVYGLGGIKIRLKQLFVELINVSNKGAIFSLGEMTSPPKEKGLFWLKLHELVVEPLINLIWQFQDLNLTNLFRLFNIKILKRKYFDTHYLGSMTLLVGKNNEI